MTSYAEIKAALADADVSRAEVVDTRTVRRAQRLSLVIPPLSTYSSVSLDDTDDIVELLRDPHILSLFQTGRPKEDTKPLTFSSVWSEDVMIILRQLAHTAGCGEHVIIHTGIYVGLRAMWAREDVELYVRLAQSFTRSKQVKDPKRIGRLAVNTISSWLGNLDPELPRKPKATPPYNCTSVPLLLHRMLGGLSRILGVTKQGLALVALMHAYTLQPAERSHPESLAEVAVYVDKFYAQIRERTKCITALCREYGLWDCIIQEAKETDLGELGELMSFEPSLMNRAPRESVNEKSR